MDFVFCYVALMNKNKLAIDTYNKIANIYTNKYFEDLVDSPFIDKFLSLLPKASKVLDIGCGPGNFTKYMLDKGFDVEGIDLSENMLKIAHHKVPEGKFAMMDMRDLEQGSESFEGLLVAYALIHIPSEDILTTLKGFYKVLKPHGKVLFITQAGEADRIVDEPLMEGEKIFINFFTRNRLAKFLEEAGFGVIFQKEKKIGDIEAFSNRVIYTIAEKLGGV